MEVRYHRATSHPTIPTTTTGVEVSILRGSPSYGGTLRTLTKLRSTFTPGMTGGWRQKDAKRAACLLRFKGDKKMPKMLLPSSVCDFWLLTFCIFLAQI